MGLSITIPGNGQTAKVRTTGGPGSICAKGTANRPGNIYPNSIFAMIYLMEPDPIPSGPPDGATQGEVYSNDQWQFTGTSEIQGASSSAMTPYPESWLVVWAGFGSPTPSYDFVSVSFLGMSSTGTDCSS